MRRVDSYLSFFVSFFTSFLLLFYVGVFYHLCLGCSMICLAVTGLLRSLLL